MHVSQLSRAAARQCRKRPQPELEQAVSDIYPRLIRTEAGDPHETPAQRPPRRSRETPLLSRPGPDYRPRKSALMTARWLVSQLGDVLVPLPRCEASGSGANPVDGVLDVQVPEPGRAVVTGAGQRVPVWAECHRVRPQGAPGQGLAEWPGVGGIGDVPQPDRAAV